MRIAPIAINPQEAQFIETMKLTATNVAAIYGVPPDRVGGEKSSSLTYSTVEQDSIDFVGFYSGAQRIPEIAIPLVMPKPVTIYDYQVRLRVPINQIDHANAVITVTASPNPRSNSAPVRRKRPTNARATAITTPWRGSRR